MSTHTHIGQTSHGKPVSLTRDERLRHMAIFGSTGVGKTTFLLNIVAQDIARGDGLLVIDPHGDFAEKALSLVPPSRNNQVCYFNLTDSAYPVGFNVLEDVTPDHRAVVADGVVAGMRAIWTDMWGPRLEQILRHSCAALIETPNASLVLLPRLLTDARFRARITSRITNPLTRDFFERQFNSWRDSYREEAIAPVLNKIDAFLFSPAIRNVIGQAKSSLHFEQAMQRRRIVIANLARGIIGETPSNLMGALLLARVQAAGMARASLPQEARIPFHIVIDEVQLFGTDVIAQILGGPKVRAVAHHGDAVHGGLEREDARRGHGQCRCPDRVSRRSRGCDRACPGVRPRSSGVQSVRAPATAARRSHGAHRKRRGRARGDASRSPSVRMCGARQRTKPLALWPTARSNRGTPAALAESHTVRTVLEDRLLLHSSVVFSTLTGSRYSEAYRI